MATTRDSRQDSRPSSAAAAASAPPACGSPIDTDAAARLARVAKALSDPIRLRMLDVMGQGRSCCGLPEPAARGVPGAGEPAGICVCEFQEQFGLAQSRTSYHLRVLRDAGLVSEETRGKWSFYTVDREAVDEALRAFGELLRH
jgi:ArsR family transcriptional regulator, arsenate/arsenite/antimonite-responsive transcriptional repressor